MGRHHVASLNGGYLMRQTDFTPFYRSAIGFDRLFQMLDQASGFDNESTYPPYNIERTGDNAYRISLAVAGFDTGEIKVEIKEQTLTIAGDKKAESPGKDLPASRHRGPLVRAPVPACRPRRCDGGRYPERLAACRSGPQRAGAHEAAVNRHWRRNQRRQVASPADRSTG